MGWVCCWEQSLLFQIVLWWITWWCSLAHEKRSPWEKVNNRTKYRESPREPLHLTGPKKSGCSGRYFLLLDLLGLSSFSPLGVQVITCRIMPTVYYSFFFGRKTVQRGKKLAWNMVGDQNILNGNGCIHLNSMLFFWLRNSCDVYGYAYFCHTKIVKKWSDPKIDTRMVP